jgi:peroxiredoxin
MADGRIQVTTLEDLLAEPPVLLAFFPGAFTGTCTSEMQALEERFGGAPVTVVGISRDLPFALNAFRDAEGLSVPLIADPDAAIMTDYGVVTDFADIGLDRIARRAVFLLDGAGQITYRWVGSDPTVEPPYDAIADALVE